MKMKKAIITLLMCVSALTLSAQNLVGRVYYGADILNQGKSTSSVEANVRLEFVSATKVRYTPTIKAKPDASLMVKFGMKMANKKMAKQVAEKPLLDYTVKNGVITVIGGGKKGKGNAVYTIVDGGKSLRCNDGEKTYTLKLKE